MKQQPDEPAPGPRGGADDDQGAAAQLLAIRQIRIGAAAVVAVTGEVDMLTAPRLRNAVRTALDDPQAGEVVIDLTAVTFLSSAGLAALVEATQAAARRHEPLRVVVDHARPVIQPIKITGLDGVLALYHRLDEALPPAAEPTF